MKKEPSFTFGFFYLSSKIKKEPTLGSFPRKKIDERSPTSLIKRISLFRNDMERQKVTKEFIFKVVCLLFFSSFATK
jgi:hypothetical protein